MNPNFLSETQQKQLVSLGAGSTFIYSWSTIKSLVARGLVKPKLTAEGERTVRAIANQQNKQKETDPNG